MNRDRNPQTPRQGAVADTTFLTVNSLAERWHAGPGFVRKNYQRWGRRPITIARKLLFRLDEIEALERRNQENGAFREKRYACDGAAEGEAGAAIRSLP